MGIFDLLTITSIGLGAAIMLLAVLKTSRLRQLVIGVNGSRWLWLGRLMVVFFIGYIASIVLIVFGYHDPLLLITGLVFLLGSCFVYLVVFSAKSDIVKINDANTLLAQKNEALKKINLELDHFAYRTSHDLKAPITSLKGLIKVASMTNNPEEIIRIHNMMHERLIGLENLIRDILDLSKNARTDLNNIPVQVDSLIGDLIRNQGHRDNAKVQMSVEGDRGLKVMVDSTRFNMVLSNLVSNAVQYSDPRKSNHFVKVDYWAEDGSLFVAVKDNGRGIAKEHLNKVFDMFFRGEENSKGSGLGLYIVKETAEKMGGSVDVISERGVGTEFIVSFPAQKVVS